MGKSSIFNIKKFITGKNIFLAFIILFITFTCASMVALANSSKVTVEVPTLNVRSGPGLSNEIVHQAQEDEELNIIDEQNEWFKVRLSNDQVGWVASWLVEEQEVTTESQEFGRVNYDSVNVREYGTTDSGILGTISLGTEVQILFEENGWTQILYGDQVGWIHSDYVDPIATETETESAETGETVQIGSSDVNVRSQPDTSSEVVSVASPDETYPYIGSENGWYKIQLNDATTGYISESYADLSSEATAPETQESEAPATTNISEATIVIDPGHGGKDPGAVNGEFYEKNASLSTAYILQRKLESAGANVIMSRSDDSFISLNDRVVTSANANADAFISLHYDASRSPGSASGTTTYYYSNADEQLAQAVNSHLGTYGPLNNNGYRPGNYYVLRNNPAPSLLLELGYMNNSNDLAYIQSSDYQATVADAIYLGLSEYFSN